MRQLIRYAGWEGPPVRRVRREVIDVRRALELREQGMKWSEVGVILASEAGREEPYFGDSVRSAITRHRKG